MLEGKLREFIDRTKISLPPERKAELAAELTRMIRGWLTRTGSERDEYLKKTTEKLLRRFAQTQSYTLRLRVSNADATDSDVASAVSVYLRRVVNRVGKEASRWKSHPSADAQTDECATFDIRSIQRIGDEHEILSQLSVARMPRRIVRRGVLLARRKGALKLASVRFED